MLGLRSALAYQAASITVFALVYTLYSLAFADDFGLVDEDGSRASTLQNCLYYAAAKQVAMGTPEFAPQTPLSRAITVVQLLVALLLVVLMMYS